MRALVKLPDTDDPAPMPAVRNRAADIVIRASSFIRHCSFRDSSFSPLPAGQAFLWNGIDPQLGWYVYHYRHYSPELGRWPSRDPIKEDGGVNLYGFVGNGSLSEWDPMGGFPSADCCELEKHEDLQQEIRGFRYLSSLLTGLKKGTSNRGAGDPIAGGKPPSPGSAVTRAAGPVINTALGLAHMGPEMYEAVDGLIEQRRRLNSWADFCPHTGGEPPK